MPPFFLLLLLWMAGQPVSVPSVPDPFTPPALADIPKPPTPREWWQASRNRKRNR